MKKTLSVLIVCLSFLVATSAFAQSPSAGIRTGYHNPTRPLVLEPMTLEASFGANINLSKDQVAKNIPMAIGAGFGIIENLEAGLMLNLQFIKDPDEINSFQNPDLYVRYGIIPELAVELAFNIPVEDGAKLGIAPAVVFSKELHDMFVMNAGLSLSLVLTDPMQKNFYLNLAPTFKPSDCMALALDFGVYMPDFETDAMTMPLALAVYHTLEKNYDIFGKFGLTNLKEDAIDNRYFLIGFSGRFGL